MASFQNNKNNGTKVNTSENISLKSLQSEPVGEKALSGDKRQQWSHTVDFLFACVGYAVSGGNIYRFPYLCFRNGGGAFLIPYFTALVLCGVPLFFLELALGQFSGKGPLHIWELCPLFKGLGYGMVIISGVCTSYYNVVMAWILYYIIKSCAKVVPWSSCGNPWNTPKCRSFLDYHNNTSFANTSVSLIGQDLGNMSYTTSLLNQTSQVTNNFTWNSAATEYWRYKALKISSGIDDFGGINWDMFGIYALGWFITFICLFKGVKSMGKAAYVTSTLPYILLTILLIRGALLPGAIDGIKYYIIPEWSKLLNLKIWTEACLQIFYSLGPAWGGLVTLASHNKFHHNCLRDAVMIPIINCATSFYGGFVIFSVVGYIAHLTGKTVEQVGASGLGLTFIAYPEAISQMPISPLWAILFFLMMLSLVIDSQFGMFETMVGSIVDTFPGYLRNRTALFTAAVCICEALLGFLFCSQAGYYIFTLVEWYVGAFSLILISCAECWIIYWIYGIDRFYYDIYLMIGKKPSWLWKICWGFISPGLLLVVWTYNLVNYAEPYYLDYVYPKSALAVGWFISVLPMFPVVYFIIKEILAQNGSFKQRVLKSLQPTPSWGPSDKSCSYKPKQLDLEHQGVLPLCLGKQKVTLPHEKALLQK